MTCCYVVISGNVCVNMQYSEINSLHFMLAFKKTNCQLSDMLGH